MSQNLDDRTIEEVQKHYSRSGQEPFLLADLGKSLRDSGFTLPAGLTLKNYLATQLAGRLKVVQDPNVPARVAVTLPENETEILEQLSCATALPSRRKDANGFAFPLILAFCVPSRPGQKLFFRRIPPFRYSFSDVPLGGEFIEIEDEYRPAGIVGTFVKNLTCEQKLEMFGAIKTWAASKGIDWHAFLAAPKAPTARGLPPPQNALERFITAQPPDLRARINIPLDIAAALMRQR